MSHETEFNKCTHKKYGKYFGNERTVMKWERIFIYKLEG